MSCNVTPEVFEKTEFEKIAFAFDFSPIMEDSETINSVPTSPSVTSVLIGGGVSDLEITEVQIDGQRVEFFIGGGSHARRYRVNCRIYTSSGEQLELEGTLRIRG